MITIYQLVLLAALYIPNCKQHFFFGISEEDTPTIHCLEVLLAAIHVHMHVYIYHCKNKRVNLTHLRLPELHS